MLFGFRAHSHCLPSVASAHTDAVHDIVSSPLLNFLRKGNLGLARRFQLENAFVFEDYDDKARLESLLATAASPWLLVVSSHCN